MRLVFMGTPAIAVPTLEKLAQSREQDVLAVFTQPDRPKGRGHHLLPPPVKECAAAHGIDVFQPLSLRKEPDASVALKALQTLELDLIVVIAYGQILPLSVLTLPRYGCINLHASLLPKYRGASPIQAAILNGDDETGVTAMQMNEGLDTGDMLLQKAIAIDPEETADALSERLAILAAQTLFETLDLLENDELSPAVQDDAKSSYAPRLTKEMSRLDFTRPAREVHNLIRALTGFTTFDGRRLKVYASRVVEHVSGAPGTIADAATFTVCCGDGAGVRFMEIQPEGKRRMETREFLRGRTLFFGERLGE